MLFFLFVFGDSYNQILLGTWSKIHICHTLLHIPINNRHYSTVQSEATHFAVVGSAQIRGLSRLVSTSRVLGEAEIKESLHCQAHKKYNSLFINVCTA